MPIPPAPVPLRPRQDGWTEPRQRAFLEALGDCASVTEAARRVGMSHASAYRLRRHPLAENFRRCWDAQLAGVWQRAEQTALERMVNGTVETLVRNGEEVMRRAKPCSDSFLLAMLRQQLRRAELALAEAEAAAQAAHRAKPHGWGRNDPAPVAPEAPALETGALTALHGQMATLPDAVGWDAPEVSADAVALAPMPVVPERLLESANGRIVITGRAARLKPPRPAHTPRSDAPARRETADELDWRKYKESAAARDLPPEALQDGAPAYRRKGPRISRTWD